MPESAAFLDALKRCLKSRGLTYATLAPRLELSEASVKRVFAEGTLSLERIGQILEILEMSFLDVAKLSAGREKSRRNTLTDDQERLLAADPELFAYFHLLLFGKTPDEILKAYQLTPAAATKHQERLSESGLIERRGRGVKLLIGRALSWREGGPLRTVYRDQILHAFLNGDCQDENALQHFMTRSLSHASQTLLRRKLDHLRSEVDELSRLDSAGANVKTHVTGVLVAIRPFSFVPAIALKKRGSRV